MNETTKPTIESDVTIDRRGRIHRPKYTREQVLAAVEKGITVLGTAKVLKVSTDAVYAYARRWSSVAKALKDKRMELVDLSEMALRGAILRNEPWAIALTLKTLGKDNGYTERQEIISKNEETSVVLRVVKTENDSEG